MFLQDVGLWLLVHFFDISTKKAHHWVQNEMLYLYRQSTYVKKGNEKLFSC